MIIAAGPQTRLRPAAPRPLTHRLFSSLAPAAKDDAIAIPIPFVLFLAVSAILFVRPAELVPAVEGWPIYAVLMTAALLVALPAILAQLSPAALLERPITACVAGLLVAVVLSHLSRWFVWGARVSGTEFCKVVLYYLLLAAVVDSPARLRQFFNWLVVLGVVVTTLALLQYHEWIDLPALAEIEQGVTSPTGERSIVLRLVSTGIFNDPNDLCLLLILTIAACAHGFEDPRWGAYRICWAAPLALFAYAFSLTHSRGGFLGLLAAVVVFIWVRLGPRRGIQLAALALPVMFYLFAGRQTELGVGDGTGQERVQLWSEGLRLFRRAPLFGIGYGNFVEEVGKVAHNSFVHTFAELGLFGGACFLGAFALAFRTLARLGPAHAELLDDDLLRLRPYLMAIVGGYIAGMTSLSRPYVVPTYLVLGLVAVYVELARRDALEPVALPRVNSLLVYRLAALAVAFIACTYVFIRLFVNWK